MRLNGVFLFDSDNVSLVNGSAEATPNALFPRPDDDRAMKTSRTWRPTTEWENPVWGWLLINYRDSGVQIFDGKGTFLAEALLHQETVTWRPEGVIGLEDFGSDD